MSYIVQIYFSIVLWVYKGRLQITTWQFFFVLRRSDVVIQTAVDIKTELQTSARTSIARQGFQQVQLH